MNAVLSLWMWSEIALCSIAGFWVQAPLTVATWPFDRNRKIGGRFFRLIGVAVSKLSPYWDFGVEGDAPKALSGKVVVVSNHESNADPFLVSFLPWEMKWMAKQSLFKVPFVGWSMWLAGDIGIVRGKEGEAKRALDICAQWLRRGMPVMIFPEGTRSKDGSMGAFKDGAFRLAIEEQADILPLAIAGTRKALPKHSWRFSKSRARVKVGERISTAGMTLKDLEPLKERVREQIAKMRNDLLPHTTAAD
ncbi:MAG: lysophospholipid acyltransferase family protein [Myxococcaceae bacterium]